MKVGPGPTLAEAMDRIARTGAAVGGDFAAQWARELRLWGKALAAGDKFGPRGHVWRLEASRAVLQADIAEHAHSRAAALAGMKAVIDQLPELHAKAVDDVDALAVSELVLEVTALLDEEAEQARLRPQGADAKAASFEGKSIQGWSREQRQAFIDLIKAGGGGTADGRGFRGDPLHATEAGFARAEAVVRGEVEPTAAERVALERFNRASVLGAGP
jgi:hypothetical protein